MSQVKLKDHEIMMFKAKRDYEAKMDSIKVIEFIEKKFKEF